MGIQQALVTVTGNLGADPVPFTTSAGVPACSFRLAVTPRFFDQGTGQWRDRGTSWVGVCAYRALSKNILGSLNKGDPAIVAGTMRIERWQKDGVDRVTPVIDASAVGPDLSQGIARLNRIPRNQTGAGGAGDHGASAVANTPEAGAAAPGAGSQYGPPSNNPLNPAIPANPVANAGGAPGVVIDTSGIGDDTGGTVANDDAAAVSGEPAGDGGGTGATGDDADGSAGSTIAGGAAEAAAGDAAVDPVTGEMREPDDFNSGTM